MIIRSCFLHKNPLASAFTGPRYVLLQDLTPSPFAVQGKPERSRFGQQTVTGGVSHHDVGRRHHG